MSTWNRVNGNHPKREGHSGKKSFKDDANFLSSWTNQISLKPVESGDNSSRLRNKASVEVPKTCIVLFGQQGATNLVAERLRVNGCLREKGH